MLSCFVMVLIAVLISLQAFAAEPMEVLDISAVKQLKSNWCWAASGESILNYFGYAETQKSFAVYVTGNAVPPNTGKSDLQVQEGLAHWGIEGTRTGASIGYSTIQSDIRGGSPIYAGIIKSNGIGHAVVINGFDSSIGQYIQYMDPADGKFHQSTYSSFKGGVGYPQTWDGTIYDLKN